MALDQVQAEGSPSADAAGEGRRRVLQEFGRTAGLIGTILLVMAIFAIASDGRFLQPENLLGLLRYMSTLAIVGLGLTVVLIVGEIDLSFGAVYGFSGMITAVAWISWGWSIGMAIGLALAAAILVGLFNGFFTTVTKIPSFIATLGASTLVFGFTLLVSGSATFSPLQPGPGRTMNETQVDFFRGLSNQDLPLGLPMGAVWMAVIALGFWYLISKSLFGFRLKAIGGNPIAAQFARIPVRRYKIWSFVICALSAAVAAILVFAFIGSVQPDSGAGLLLPDVRRGRDRRREPVRRQGDRARDPPRLPPALDPQQRPGPDGGRRVPPADLHRRRHDRRGRARPGDAALAPGRLSVSTTVTTRGIEISGLVKRYGDTWALAGLDLVARPGEILGVAGPNGAGKSTLVKVLASETVPDSGVITLDGAPWRASSDADRVAVVHQEPQLFGNLTVAENLLVGQEPTRLVRPRGRDADRDVLREVGLLPYANVPVGSLPLALQQRTEIARALAKRADVFLFDEPNSALTEAESAELFDRMHALAAQDKVILLVSHRLAELAAHCDRIVVIVDGKVRTELAQPHIDQERIARELVVGRAGPAAADRSGRPAPDRRLLHLSGWTHRHARFTDVELALRAGEVRRDRRRRGVRWPRARALGGRIRERAGGVLPRGAGRPTRS